MDEDKTLDSLFARFADIVNPLMSLGKNITEEDQVIKLLYSLKGTEWTQKRSIIEATQNLKKMSFEGLMGNLKAHEVQLAVDANVPKKDGVKMDMKKSKEERNVAFKAMEALHIDSTDSDDDDVEVALKRLVKTMMKKKSKKVVKKDNDKFVVCCYKCNERGHLKNGLSPS